MTAIRPDVSDTVARRPGVIRLRRTEEIAIPACPECGRRMWVYRTVGRVRYLICYKTAGGCGHTDKLSA